MSEITIDRDDLKSILEMHADATELLETIPVLQDEGRTSEASQHIGAELESRITKMNEVEKNNETVRRLINEIQGSRFQDTELEKIEEELLSQ